MKIIGIVSGIILFLIVAGLFMIQIQKEDTDITLQKTSVAMIMIGAHDDHSWSEAHYKSLEKSALELNLDVNYIENVNDMGTVDSVLENAIAKGAKIVIANSFGFGEPSLNVAKRHPEVYFFHASGVKKAENLSTFFGRIYQMRYLSGIVAGLQTKTNEIGVVAAFEISEVNRGINAFALGVRSVNPNAKIFVNWCHSWTDEEAASKSTNELLKRHNIDLITVAADALSPYEIAEKEGVWIIGYNVDNAALYPNRFLTAPIWKWENFYTPRIREVLQHKFHADNYWLGVESGIVGLAPFTEHVTAKAKEIVEREAERMRNGTFDVFYGPIKDNKGTVRIESGESMSDEAMLNYFDWYVEGVVIDD